MILLRDRGLFRLSTMLRSTSWWPPSTGGFSLQMPEGDCCSGPTMPGSWPRSHNSHCRSHRPVPSAPVRSVGAAFIVQPDFFAALVSREDGGAPPLSFSFS